MAMHDEHGNAQSLREFLPMVLAQAMARDRLQVPRCFWADPDSPLARTITALYQATTANHPSHEQLLAMVKKTADSADFICGLDDLSPPKPATWADMTRDNLPTPAPPPRPDGNNHTNQPTYNNTTTSNNTTIPARHSGHRKESKTIAIKGLSIPDADRINPTKQNLCHHLASYGIPPSALVNTNFYILSNPKATNEADRRGSGDVRIEFKEADAARAFYSTMPRILSHTSASAYFYHMGAAKRAKIATAKEERRTAYLTKHEAEMIAARLAAAAEKAAKANTTPSPPTPPPPTPPAPRPAPEAPENSSEPKDPPSNGAEETKMNAQGIGNPPTRNTNTNTNTTNTNTDTTIRSSNPTTHQTNAGTLPATPTPVLPTISTSISTSMVVHGGNSIVEANPGKSTRSPPSSPSSSTSPAPSASNKKHCARKGGDGAMDESL